MQLDLYCQQWDNGTKSAMSRHIYHYLTGFYQGQKTLMVQRSKVASKPLPDNKTQEEKANEEINLINALNPRDTGLVAGWPPQSPNPLLDTPEIGSREPTAPPLYDEGRVSPSKTHQGTQVNIPIQSKTLPFQAISYKRSKSGRPAHWPLLGPYSVFHFRLTELEKFQLLIQRGASEIGRFYHNPFLPLII